jgi:hypothetical protein
MPKQTSGPWRDPTEGRQKINRIPRKNERSPDAEFVRNLLQKTGLLIVVHRCSIRVFPKTLTQRNTPRSATKPGTGQNEHFWERLLAALATFLGRPGGGHLGAHT